MKTQIATLLLCVALATGAGAQETPENGFASLVEAGKLLPPVEEVHIKAVEGDQESLRRQRLAAERNAPALKLLRESLKQPLNVPPHTSFDGFSFQTRILFNGLVNALIQESEVRLADGDAVGALDSRLTAMEFAASLTRGTPVVGIRLGAFLEFKARENIARIVGKLDAAQIRAALPRLHSLETRRASYAQSLEVQKANIIRLVLPRNDDLTLSATDRSRFSLAERLKTRKLPAAKERELGALTPELLAEQLTPFFVALATRNQQPFADMNKTVLPSVDYDVFAGLTDLVIFGDWRFAYELNRAQHRLLEAALELRAIKLETAAYPTTFSAPLDPFAANHALIYKRRGEGFSLYSVGPDGLDDGGTPVQTIETQQETGAKVVSERVTLESKGDIHAPEL